jgi:hypothetical protein
MLPEIFEKHAGPDELWIFEGVSDERLAEYQRVIRSKPKAGAQLVHNHPADVKTVKLDPRTQFQTYLEHIINQVYLGGESVFPVSELTFKLQRFFLFWACSMLSCDVEIVDVTDGRVLEGFPFGCLTPMTFRRYRRRSEYLEDALPRGFRKKVLVWKGEVVGQIEYAPPEGAGYPIRGEDIIVMNCIWVLRKAKGHHFGTHLMKEMIESEPDASGFATIGLEDHWSPWLKKDQLEKLGFRSIDHVHVSHKTKHVSEPFTVHLMWLPRRKDAQPPTWDKRMLLEGVYWCLAHPLYHPQTCKPKEILQKSRS